MKASMPKKTTLPIDLETIFTTLSHDPDALFMAFMPALCDHLKADRIFLQPRNPAKRVCKILRWRRHEGIPWPNFPTIPQNTWFHEQPWEATDPLFAAALACKPSIYVEDLATAAAGGVLNLQFETEFMRHSAFVHGHAVWPPLGVDEEDEEKGEEGEEQEVGEDGKDGEDGREERKFYGSVQPAVFDGPRVWTEEERCLMEGCLVRIVPFMKACGEGAPDLEI